MATDRPNLTVLLPTKREAENLPYIIQRLHAELDPLVDQLEILIVDAPTDDGTEQIARETGSRYVADHGGYADALRTGFREATHEWIVTMDADGSHDPLHIRWMLAHRHQADIVLCSRYVPRAGQDSSWFRYFTSRVLNYYLGFACTMPVQDLSGGFKLYRKSIFNEFQIESQAFEVQCEIAIRAYGSGFRIVEIPFQYHPRLEGRSKAAIAKYGMAFLKRSLRLRSYRNSRAFCDYDERAYNSRIPVQRYWQRRRYAQILDMLPPTGRCLDVGCGTDRLIIGYPRIVGLDISRNILRYLSHEERRLTQGTAAALPFQAASFDTAYCCEVAEHLPPEVPVFDELARVLKPGGKLLVTTPDYGSVVWPLLENVYEALLRHNREGHAHLTRYNLQSLHQALTAANFRIVREERLFGCLLFVLCEYQPS